MNASIAKEFVPQETERIRTSLTKYIDLPYITKCGAIRKTSYERASVKPPSIPRLAIEKFDIPPISDAVLNLELDASLFMPRVDFKVSTRRPTPPHGQRIPPNIPRGFLSGHHSGYCRIEFDINEDGWPINIKAPECTDDILRDASIEAVQKWRYGESNNQIHRERVKTKIEYRLLDDKGDLLPLPAGY